MTVSSISYSSCQGYLIGLPMPVALLRALGETFGLDPDIHLVAKERLAVGHAEVAPADAAARPPTPPSPSPPRDAEGLVSYARRERAKFEALAHTHEQAMKSLGSFRPSGPSATRASTATPTSSLLTRVDNMQNTFEQLRTPQGE